MADALCGPSNALQNFKQHTQVDRTLQQDRLTGPRTSSQGFRSSDPRTGSLDADFHAFENASASPFQEPFIGNEFVAPPQFQQYVPTSWANDFQHLSISDQPLPAQQFRNYAPLVKSTTGGWHNEFLKQQQQHSGQSSVAYGKHIAFGQPSMLSQTSQMSYQGNFAPTSSVGPIMNSQQPLGISNMQLSDQTAGADWSQAFEEAFQDAFVDAEQMQQIEDTQDHMTQESESVQVQPDEITAQPMEQTRIGSDAINYTEVQDRTADQEQKDASALARVAGELLHNVQHDSSEKFQNSQFLDLMRRIRDRQIEVRNNDFEQTDASDGATKIQFTPNTAPLTDQHIHDEPDPQQDQDTFAFPNMDTVYTPRQADFVDYTFENDQFPIGSPNQISHLHPGGKFYPGQSPIEPRTEMSGAVSGDSGTSASTISTADFEAAYDESRGLASRYQRTAA